MKRVITLAVGLLMMASPSLFSSPALRIYAKYLPKNPVIVEAGAHNGSATQSMKVVWPDSKIYAFEPCPEMYNQLIRNIASYSNVFTFPFALGDRDGIAKFYISRGGDGGQGSLLPPGEGWIWPYITLEETVDVPVRTLDSWAKKTMFQKWIFYGLICRGWNFKCCKHPQKFLVRSR